MVTWDWLLSKCEITMCPLKEAIFSRILFCNPMPVDTETIIMTTLMAIAVTAIFIIGEEMLFLLLLESISFLAMKSGRFNGVEYFCFKISYFLSFWNIFGKKYFFLLPIRNERL